MKKIKRIKSLLHTKIYRVLINHPSADALAAVVKNRKNKDFCKLVAGRNDLFLEAKSYGQLNRDKNIYLIKHGKSTSGFFVQMRELLKYLAYADRFGFNPVVEWNSCIPYAEKHEVFGTKNSFEYYFEQPSGISISEARDSYNVFEAKEIHINNTFLNREIINGENGYWMSEEYIEKLSIYARKYIRLNIRTKEYIDKSITDLFKDEKHVLGVHIRGTDYNVGYNAHPINATVEEYFACMDRIIQEGKYEKIFLATDDKRLLKIFVEKYGSKILYYSDVIRGEKNESVAFSDNQRNNDKYLLGLEVLRDMYTLVRCDALVAGISQVSISARIFRKSTGTDYEEKVILDKGYYQNSMVFVN